MGLSVANLAWRRRRCGRRLPWAGLAVPAVLLLAACGTSAGAPGAVPSATSPGPSVSSPSTTTQATTASASTVLPATSSVATGAAQAVQPAVPAPNCNGAPTPAVEEGPFFKRNSPERTSLLEPKVAGTPLTITGYVVGTDCKPVAHALLDFWQANAQGRYDNAGYTLRGHQFTDDEGRFTLQTIVPGDYPGRTGHIHVKVQAPNGPLLTTQLYLPGDARNRTDPLFNSATALAVHDVPGGKQATFTFVIAR